jgi:hypothetical protein
VTLVIIFGPPAVGKMTVGLELERLTGFRLFHNHMTVDPVVRLFPFNSPAYLRLLTEFRRRIFEEYAATDSRGLIFTFVWALDDPQDRAFVDSTARMFIDRGAEICFVELEATQAERLRRNETPLRLAEKRPQRDTVGSRAFLLDADRMYQLNTREAFFYPERYLKIDNTALTPDVVARRIVDHFALPADPEGLALAGDGGLSGKPAVRLKAYLDNNVVSAIARDDTPAESAALDRILAAQDVGMIDLVTSELTLEEISRCAGPARRGIERTFRLLQKVAVVRWDELLGMHSDGDSRTWISCPLIQNDPLYDALLKLGLGTVDAQHVFVAGKQRCAMFLTCDGGVLARASGIQQLCGVAVQRPSVLVASQGW